MNLPGFSVKRPIFTTMVTLILVILGAVSLSRLQIDMLPNIELPTLTIRTDYDGASPEVMERLVTQIVEEIVATVPGVEEITSSSSEGRSTVRVSFVWGTDIDTAAIDVQGKIEDEINELPDDIVGPVPKIRHRQLSGRGAGRFQQSRSRGADRTDRSPDPLSLCPHSRCCAG
jgi:HAE1 family hydrophobic/amphiphilic exporter-1